MTPAASQTAVHDRNVELSAIRNAIRRAATGSGQLVLIHGPAGIGKTTLLKSAAMIGDELGVRELSARGSDLERDFGFGVVQQLLLPVLKDPDDYVHSVSARLAARAIGLGLTDGDEGIPHGPDASFATLNGLHQLTDLAAQSSPLLLLVDDAHDADPASVRFLAYLAPRVRTMPVCLVVAFRSPPNGLQPGISTLLDDVHSLILRPRPLGRASAREVIRAAVPDASDAICDACRTASGGNPFFLHELGDALRREHRAGVDPGTATELVPGLLPARVIDAVRARLRGLPAAASQLASGVAVMGDGALLRYSAEIARLDLARAAEVADALVAAEVFAPERPPRFLHPLIRTAVYGDLAPGERAAKHAAAARLLSADDAAPERVAAHLLATDPGSVAGAVEQLRIAAGVAVRRGAPEAAVTYLARALQEPPSSDTRPLVLLGLGEAEALTRNPGPAAEHLQRALETLREPEHRLRAAIMLAEILGTDGRPQESMTVLEHALKDSVGAPPDQLGRIEAHLTNIARTDLEIRRRSLPQAAQLRRRAWADELQSGVALAAAAAEEAMAGESREETARLARRALGCLAAEGTFPGDFTVFTVVRCLLACDHLDEARVALERAEEQARLLGAVVAAATAEAFVGDLQLRAGNIPAAIKACEDALQRARDGWGLGIPAASALLAEGLLERGELMAAQAAITAGGLDGPAEATGSSYVLTMLLHARGRVRLAAGDGDGALADLLETGRRQGLMAELNPALIPWRSGAARALARLGRNREALGLAEEELLLARRFGAPRALGVALVVAGEIQAGSAGEARLRQAEQILRNSPARLAHAEALSALGHSLAKSASRAAARQALTEALDHATACGASALQERVVGQLRATGARPRRLAARGVTALTPGELRVAKLAAHGLKNREIADAMYVTVRTVEFHLGGVFRKLGIGSRRELSLELLATSSAGDAAAPPAPPAQPAEDYR